MALEDTQQAPVRGGGDLGDVLRARRGERMERAGAVRGALVDAIQSERV